MRVLRRWRMAATVAIMTIIALVSPLVGSVVVMAQPMMNGGPSVVAFPFENTTGKGTDQLGSSLSAAIRATLSQQYAVYGFNPKSPSVERAVSENRLTRQDIAPPFDTDKAVKIGKEMGADLVMVGSIDEITYDPNAKTSSLTVTVQLVDVKTGTPAKTTAVTGRSKEGAQSADEGALMAQALDDVIAKTTQALGVEKAAPAPGEQPKARGEKKPVTKKARNRTATGVLLGLLVILLAASSNGGGGGGGSSTELPPPPP
ncbi:MAG: hypothetical protein IT210_11420 [Armatimonadetes bacterium]|nr:hypothetical protein [Armatimonadota bacterium]